MMQLNNWIYRKIKVTAQRLNIKKKYILNRINDASVKYYKSKVLNGL